MNFKTRELPLSTIFLCDFGPSFYYCLLKDSRRTIFWYGSFLCVFLLCCIRYMSYAQSCPFSQIF